MSQASKNDLLRMLPQVEEVLNQPEILSLEEQFPRSIVTDFVRQAIEDVRRSILEGYIQVDSSPEIVFQALSCEAIVLKAQQCAYQMLTPSLRKVINVSGVVVHTNLGRSVLPDVAINAVQEVASSYSTLEYDPAKRARGSRHDHYEKLICTLTGAEAALAVNNNAAAVMMVLSEFAAGYEAIVSRGELVEIGGSFRIPDIMKLSQATMVEVGTTNKTHLSDYEGAISPRTALLLKVHPSNYRMVGFTESVDLPALRTLADAYNAQRRDGSAIQESQTLGSSEAPHLLVYEDQGSGAFVRLDCFGDYAEPTVTESLKKGCDLVSFSGDKLLGGPQAGIIVGKKSYIERLKKNPLARALRLDKMTIAALEATLHLYLDKERAVREIPTLRMLSMPAEEVREGAEKLQKILSSSLPKDSVDLSIVEEIARAGGGSLPMSDIPSYAVCINFKRGNAQDCGDYLISNRPIPIIARIKKEAMLCDTRTILKDEEMDEIAAALKDYFSALDNAKEAEGS